MHEYMDMLKREAMNDPFSKAPAILKEAQIIATDICQRRETKITNSAVLNIHRSYHLFTGKPQFDLVDTTPLNLTPEEEQFYYSLIDTLKNHRNNISLEDLSEDEKEKGRTTIIKPIETQTNTLTPEKPVERPKEEIIKQKPIVKEVKPEEKPPVNPPKPKPVENIEDNPNAFDDVDEFVDFESQSVARETELVTMLVFDEVGANRIESRHDPRNLHSGMVMKKCGMKYEGTMRSSDRNNQGICDACWYALLRSER